MLSSGGDSWDGSMGSQSAVWTKGVMNSKMRTVTILGLKFRITGRMEIILKISEYKALLLKILYRNNRLTSQL
jgi:hypothetical protein